MYNILYNNNNLTCLFTVLREKLFAIFVHCAKNLKMHRFENASVKDSLNTSILGQNVQSIQHLKITRTDLNYDSYSLLKKHPF